VGPQSRSGRVGQGKYLKLTGESNPGLSAHILITTMNNEVENKEKENIGMDVIQGV